MKKRLVLFDFDGTITTRDTFIEFLIFYTGLTRFLAGMAIMSPYLALFKLGLIPNWKAKQRVIRFFLAGETVERLRTKCDEFSEKILPSLIRPGALETINNYKTEKSTVAVVSASAEDWVEPWCRKQGMLCIATQLEIENGKVTGNLCGPNCYGPEKVKRIEKHFNLREFDEIVAYGDSAGDKEMFEIAHQSHYKPFRSGVVTS
ncbi:MAG TPA: HAD-IB family hydrolase [Chryseosolibacter sp.]